MRFNEKVWNLCKEIPSGKVTTYKIMAEQLGTKAYRAVGQALNKNPHSPVVPCHRVISSSGHLHGFAQGLEIKQKLLESEKIRIKNNLVMELERVLFKFKG